MCSQARAVHPERSEWALDDGGDGRYSASTSAETKLARLAIATIRACPLPPIVRARHHPGRDRDPIPGVDDRDLPDQLPALEQFGRQGVVELALILGNYSSLALLINSFDTDLPPDRTEPLLPV